MPFLLQYLLKLSLTLAVLYVFYYALLRKLTFYTWNRFYLLCYSLLAFVMPFINITPWIEERQMASSSFISKVNFINTLPVVSAAPSAEQVSYFSPYELVLLVFAGGAAIMLTRLLLQFISIQSIKRKATLVQTNSIRLYDVDGPISPFSFARSIFVNTRRHSEADLQKIIQHEFVHVKQQHTADLLVGELLCIVNWYNPFAWLIKKAIRQNLEFIADNSLLQSGLDAKQYQYLLLQVTGLPQYSVSNNFGISSLKKRIFMMNKLKSARAHLLKFLFVLPLLAVMLLAFRSQQQLNKQKAYLQSKDPVRDTVPPKPPKPPVPVVDVDLKKMVPPPPMPRAVKSIYMEAETNKATVVLKNGKKEVYDLTNASQRAVFDKKYSLFPVPAPPPPPVVAMLPDTLVWDMKIDKTMKKPVDPLAPVVVDVELVDTSVITVKGYRKKEKGYQDKKYSDQEQQYKIKEDQYKTKEDQYKKKEDELRKKEELYKNKEKTYNDKEAVYGTADTTVKPYAGNNSSKPLLVVGHKKGSPSPSLYVINGVISSAADFSRIDPQQIESITILKGEDATRLYGEKAAGGVVVVSTKGGRITADTGNVAFRTMNDINSLNNYKGLVVINGKEASRADVERMLATFRKDPFTLTLDMKMLKKEEALRTWGDKGKAGVMLVDFNRKTYEPE